LLKQGRWKVLDAAEASLKFKSVKLERGDHGSVLVIWPGGESGSLVPTVLNQANYVYNGAGYQLGFQNIKW
jgi:hypothetical protein